MVVLAKAGLHVSQQHGALSYAIRKKDKRSLETSVKGGCQELCLLYSNCKCTTSPVLAYVLQGWFSAELFAHVLHSTSRSTHKAMLERNFLIERYKICELQLYDFGCHVRL